MKLKSYIASIATALLLVAAPAALTSCNDIKIPGFEQLDKISDLDIAVKNRTVTLSWNAVSGAKSYKVFMNGMEIADVETTSYTIDKAPTGVSITFTVKTVFADGRMSEGVSNTVYIEFSGPKSAYLVLSDNGQNAEEKASYDWFNATYVASGRGEFVDVKDASKLDPDIYGCLMIHINRVGLEKGGSNLPIPVEAKNEIARYAKAGGNLFLSNQASQLVADLGRVDAQYDVNIYGNGAGGYNPDVWTICPFLGYACDPVYDNRDHAIFAGLKEEQISDWAPGYPMEGAGVKGDRNCGWDLNGYGFSIGGRYINVVDAYQKKNKCRVLGTWSHVKDYAVGMAMDFNPTATWRGRIVAIGAATYEWAQEGNPYQKNVEQLAANAFNYMSEIPQYEPITEGAFYGYILIDDSTPDDDELASREWFDKNYASMGKGAFINAADVNSLSAEEYNCIMIHVDRVGLTKGIEKLPGSLGTSKFINAVSNYVKGGGNLFLSNHACQFVEAIGRIPANCGVAGFGAGDGGAGGDYWSTCPYQGYQDYGVPGGNCKDYTGHPIYKGMTLTPELVTEFNFPPGFALIGKEWREDHNCIYDTNAMGYTGGVNNIDNFEKDQNCQCIGTWSHVRDWCVSGMTDFGAKDEFKGRIFAAGLAAYEWHQNVGVNPFQHNIEAIAKNTLDYMAE